MPLADNLVSRVVAGRSELENEGIVPLGRGDIVEEVGQVTQTPQPVVIVAEPPKKKTVLVLSIIAGLEAVIILGLAAVLVFQYCMWGPYPYDPGMENAWIVTDDLGYQVGDYLIDGDVDAYMDLYDEDDDSVDFAAVKDDFLRVSEVATETAEYMTESYMIYEDKDTGDTIVRTTVSGTDWNTGRSIGGRLSIYVNVDTMMLTGKAGRTLEAVSQW